jgi:two-component sensor histidine kinase
MTLVEDILNGKHFPEGSRERLKTTLISLVLLLATMIMLIDVYESISQGYYTMSVIEGFSAIIYMIVYFNFPQRLSLQSTINITLAVIGFLFMISLTVPGANPQFALFWLATLPIYIFFFLGLNLGIKWTVIAVLVLIITALNALFAWYPPLYKIDFLIQLTMGYIAISYLLYSLEYERQGYEESLINTAKQREILLKEVHHRTKNNMQVMMALLDTQAFKIDDPRYKKMFRSHVDRLKSMALVHEHLYSGESYENVAIDEYLQEITQNAQQFTDHSIITDIDPLILDMKLAMNLGLVYNEALSNALEHAYENGVKGKIDVSLKKEDQKCVLRIKDYGKGFDENLDYKTLGLTLMKDIANSLNSDTIEIKNENGTEIQIHCTLERGCQ